MIGGQLSDAAFGTDVSASGRNERLVISQNPKLARAAALMDFIVYSSGEVNQSPDIDHEILKDYPSAFGGRRAERRDPAAAWTRSRVLSSLAY